MEREIKIALIGDTGVGKTTFLASFGNHTQANFIERHGYSLSACDSSVSAQLLDAFHGLERGQFPASTAQHSDYAFDVIYRGKEAAASKVGKNAVVRVTFRDYPGGWFSRPVDQRDAPARASTLRWLADAHLGLVLLDGKKIAKEGEPYARRALAQLNNEFDKLEAKKHDGIPRQWIIAVTKADCLQSDASAARMGRELRGWAREELGTFDVMFSNERQIGRHFLLLSSASAQDGKAADPRRWIGLSVVTPFALDAVLKEIADNIKNMPLPERTGWLKVLGFLGLLRTKIVSRLPKKYRTVGELLLLAMEKLGPTVLNEYDRRQAGKVATEVRLGWEQLMKQLETDEGRRAYAKLEATP